MNSNRKLILIVSIIAVLVIGGFFLYRSKPGIFMTREREAAWRVEQETLISGIIRGGNIAACDGINYKSANGADYRTICRNNIALNTALDKGAPENCAQVDDKMISRRDCELEAATKSFEAGGDESVCKKLSTTPTQEDCSRGYWITKGIRDNSAKSCDGAPNESEQNSCRDQFLLSELINVSSTSPKISCGAFVNSNFRQDCDKFQRAMTLQNSVARKSACGLIADIGLRLACQ